MVSERPVSARGTLDRARIIRAAIDLADREGIEAVTMRRVSAELGVQAMSLYNHIASKQELLDAMAGALLSTLEVPTGKGQDWRSAIATVGRRYRQLGLDHPAIFPHIVRRPLGDPVSIAALDTVFQVFLDHGFTASDMYVGFRMITSFFRGFTQDDLNRRSIEQQNATRPAVDPSSFPAVSAVFMAAVPDDEAFERSLALLITALGQLPGNHE